MTMSTRPAVVSRATCETTCYQISEAVQWVGSLLSSHQISATSAQCCPLKEIENTQHPEPSPEQPRSMLK